MDYKQKKYLITGGTGFIGSNLVRRLVKEGCSVRVFDNNSRGNLGRLEEAKEKIEYVYGDIRDTFNLSAAVKGVDSIIHLAYVNGTEFFYSKPELVLDIAVKGIINIIDLSKQFGIKELIIASSSEVYQTPPRIPTSEIVPLVVPDVFNPRYSYGGGKIITELMAVNNAKFFERMMIFRPHNIYGPDMGNEHVIPQFINKALKEEILKVQGNGLETRAFCYIDDFIDGLMLILEKGQHKEIYNIGTENEVTIFYLTGKILELMNKKTPMVFIPKNDGGTARRCPDITKLKDLGFSPKISLTEGLKKSITWYGKNEKLSSLRRKIERVI